MSEYRKQRQELERQIAETDKEWLPKIKREVSDSLREHLISNHRFLREHFEMELEVLEAAYLIKTADELGLGSIAQRDIYNPNMKGVKPRPYFTPENKALMYRAISDARRRYWKEWIDIISPLATVIISLLALLISIIALYLQLTKKIQ